MVQIHSLYFYTMATISQTINTSKRVTKFKRSTSPRLRGNPQKRVVCIRVLTISPKKPNSANRRVIRTSVLHYKTKLVAKVPGESHTLQQHSTALSQGARVRDLIGVSYSAVRGKYDLLAVPNRKTSRSRFGAKKLK
jgi:small subunit ribosomal protein S12